MFSLEEHVTTVFGDDNSHFAGITHNSVTSITSATFILLIWCWRRLAFLPERDALRTLWLGLVVMMMVMVMGLGGSCIRWRRWRTLWNILRTTTLYYNITTSTIAVVMIAKFKRFPFSLLLILVPLSFRSTDTTVDTTTVTSTSCMYLWAFKTQLFRLSWGSGRRRRRMSRGCLRIITTTTLSLHISLFLLTGSIV